MDSLKFIALDKDDLEVVSAHLQDALVKPSQILWRPKENRVVIALDRFDWESAQAAKPQYRRRRSALRFERVRSCKCRHIDTRREAALNLLAVEFTETNSPSGVVVLTFSGQATFRLEVECLEAEVVDLGPAWTTAICPAHGASGSYTP
jgi:hypothetical protein